MACATERHGDGRQIDADYATRPMVARDKGSPATPPASHLQNFLPVQLHGGDNGLIKLDARSIGLVLDSQREGRRAVRGTVAIIHEGPLSIRILARQELVPAAP